MTIDLTLPTLTLTELFVITFSDGSIAYYTNYSLDLIYGGHTYKAIPINRKGIKYYSDLQVNNVPIEFGIVGLTIGGNNYSINELMRRGFFRDAKVQIYITDFTTLTDVILIFEGRMNVPVTYGKGLLSTEISPTIDLLSVELPKLFYTEFCQVQLYSARCGLTKNSWRVQDNAHTSSTQSIIYSPVFAFSAHAEGYWSKGEIKMTSGASLNVSKTILSHQDGSIIVMFAFLDTISIGDTFDVFPGCDKLGSTCAVKFSNYANFFGFEQIPKPEIIISSQI